jgi:hypothetical protein
MSYIHTYVDNLDKQEAVEQLKLHVDAHMHEGKRNHEWWVDGIPVMYQAYSLANAIKQKAPHVMFRFNKKNPGRSLHVTVPNCPYTVALIGFGQFKMSQVGEEYVVKARGVRNEKYQPHREQYHMRFSKNMATAAKTVLANIVAYSTCELASLKLELFSRASIDAGRKKAGVLPTLCSAVSHSVLINEVRSLKAAGVVFHTAEFQAIADQCDEASKLANDERNKRVDAVFVQFMESKVTGFKAQCVTVENIRSKNDFDVKGIPATVYELSELPEFITSKISVLQILEDRNHVDGVGMKINPTLFWVEK